MWDNLSIWRGDKEGDRHRNMTHTHSFWVFGILPRKGNPLHMHRKSVYTYTNCTISMETSSHHGNHVQAVEERTNSQYCPQFMCLDASNDTQTYTVILGFFRKHSHGFFCVCVCVCTLPELRWCNNRGECRYKSDPVGESHSQTHTHLHTERTLTGLHRQKAGTRKPKLVLHSLLGVFRGGTVFSEFKQLGTLWILQLFKDERGVCHLFHNKGFTN